MTTDDLIFLACCLFCFFWGMRLGTERERLRNEMKERRHD